MPVVAVVLSRLPAAIRDRLRKIVRPKDFPIMGLRAAMVCESMCRGVGPEPQLLGVHPLPFDHRKLSWRGD